ncbi:MAG TPA: alpha/beta fold hydrolase [Bryobacteraceae bacterium]|nr:alpha/beta fold hydrolase [Bryobacteraceae bacterium]
MEPPAEKETPKTETPKLQHRETFVSPSLQRDMQRFKRALPFLVAFPVLCLITLLPAGLVIGPKDAWTRQIAPARRFGLSPQTVSFQSADEIPLKAWYERAWSVAVPKCTVILVHGSQTNKTGMGYTAARLLPHGFSVLMLDLRAHGESGGKYTTFDYREALDVEAAVGWLKAHNKGEPIAILGYSSGAVAALVAASRTPGLAAVVADSAYLDKTDVLHRERDLLAQAPPGAVPLSHRVQLWFFTTPGFAWLSRVGFFLRTGASFDGPDGYVRDAVKRLDRVPVLYLTAEKDPVVPRAVTDELYRLTPSPHKQLSIRPGSFHSALAGDPRGYITVIAAFLDNVLGTQPVSPAEP